jgi:flagellar basal-body rod protein FlgC
MSEFFSGFRVSGSGLSAQRTRLNTISSNIANINTTRTPQGGPYQKKNVVFQSIPETKNFGEILSLSDPKSKIERVQVVDIISDNKSPILKYEPNHPDANAEGYVAYPNINLMEEMTNMIQATRAYEANVSAFQSAKDMALASLEIGR